MSPIIRLAFLAAGIVEQVVKGCQPPELTAESLLKDRTQLPLNWEFAAPDAWIRLRELIVPVTVVYQPSKTEPLQSWLVIPASNANLSCDCSRRPRFR